MGIKKTLLFLMDVVPLFILLIILNLFILNSLFYEINFIWLNL